MLEHFLLWTAAQFQVVTCHFVVRTEWSTSPSRRKPARYGHLSWYCWHQGVGWPSYWGFRVDCESTPEKVRRPLKNTPIGQLRYIDCFLILFVYDVPRSSKRAKEKSMPAIGKYAGYRKVRRLSESTPVSAIHWSLIMFAYYVGRLRLIGMNCSRRLLIRLTYDNCWFGQFRFAAKLRKLIWTVAHVIKRCCWSNKLDSNIKLS